MTDFAWSQDNGFIYQLGWTLIHFLWQGALGAVVLSFVLWLLRERSAQSRYGASLLCLALLALAPVITAIKIQASIPRPISDPVGFSSSGSKQDQTPSEIAPHAVSKTSLSKPSVGNMAIPEKQQGHSNILLSSIPRWLEPCLPMLVLLWFLGVLILTIHHLAGWIAVERLRNRYVEPATEQIQQMAMHLRETLRISRAVELMHSALVDSPVTIGWLKPLILLPASALTGLSANQLEAILAHELAHIRRHDYLINLFQTGVETILFYHPAVWWISKRIRIEREHCCDDMAVAVCGDAVSYARVLVDLEQLRASGGFAMGVKRGSLLERVRRLASLKNPQARCSRDSWWVCVPAALLAMYLVMVQYLPVASSKAEKAPSNSSWVKTTKSGVEVELIGISTHPSTADSWWKPDGSALSPAPYSDDGSRVYPQDHERAYEFAVQLRNLPAEYVNTRMEAIPRGSSAGGCSDADLAPQPHTRDFVASMPKDTPECILSVSVAAGEWETVIDYKCSDGDKHWPSSSHNGNKGQFAFAPPQESEGKTVFTLTHSLTDVDYRAVAIDKEAQLHQTIRAGSQNVGNLIQTTATYDLRLADIDHFEIQRRPYEEVVFTKIPTKVTPPTSLLETIPSKIKETFNPKYFMSFPLFEKRAPTPEEDALLLRIFDRHRQIKDVSVELTQNSFSLVTRSKDEAAQKLGYLPIDDPGRLHLPETGHTVATVAGDLGEKKAHFLRTGEHWWADVSQLMGMPRTTQTGFDGSMVWFRFGDKVEIIPATMVNEFNINLAAPMGFKIEEGEARENTVYLGDDEYEGLCHVFAYQSAGCAGSDTLMINHYYFDKADLLLKKIEAFYWIRNVGEDPIYIFQVHEYAFDESPSKIDPAIFQMPKEGITESKEVAFPGPGELNVGLSDGSNGNMQASYRLNYEGGSWGSGLN